MKKIILITLFFISNAVFSQNSFKAKNNILYSVGDTLTLSNSSKEEFYKSIIQKPVGLSTNLVNAPTGLKGQKFIIKKIKIYPNNVAIFDCSFKNAGRWLLTIDEALELREIENPNFTLSKNEAIQILDEKKKLLDLGVIKKEEYDEFVKEYKSIIIP